MSQAKHRNGDRGLDHDQRERIRPKGSLTAEMEIQMKFGSRKSAVRRPEMGE